MDLSSIQAGMRDVDIKHPSTDENVGLKITIVSMEDDECRKFIRRTNDKYMKLRQKGKIATTEEMEQDQINLLAIATRSWVWSGDANFMGTTPEYSTKIGVDFYTKVKFARDQIDKEVGDTASFFVK